MPWPLSQDYNEAVQSPESSFADPELRGGEVATNALGLPMPCSGNFADVYRFNCAATTRSWAVKCFTRQIPGLQERYQQISRHLEKGKPSFIVDFTFLDRGIEICGNWYPILKMQWVEGLTLNQFVKGNLDKPQVLDSLCQLWVKLAVRLREANIAHCDLQHGNVLLVPGHKGGSVHVRLVDYDGMCVPALTLLQSMEVGHPSYQHPQRQREGIYSLEVDRFSHLVIYTALRALMVGGKALWDKYDDGDNLLFKQADFEAPAKSRLFYELLKVDDPAVRSLAEQMIEAVRRPLDQTPLLEKLVGATPPAPPALLGVQPAAVGSRQPPTPQTVPTKITFAGITSTADALPRQQNHKDNGQRKTMRWYGAACVVGLLVLVFGGLLIARKQGSKTNEPSLGSIAKATRKNRETKVAKSEVEAKPEQPITNPGVKKSLMEKMDLAAINMNLEKARAHFATQVGIAKTALLQRYDELAKVFDANGNLTASSELNRQKRLFQADGLIHGRDDLRTDILRYLNSIKSARVALAVAYAEVITKYKEVDAFDKTAALLAELTQMAPDAPLVSLESLAHPGQFMSHFQYLGCLNRISNTESRINATFEIVPGLANRIFVSFRCVNIPNHYLAHGDFRIRLQRYEDSDGYRQNGTFKQVKGLAAASAASFESINYPGCYIHARFDKLFIDKYNSSPRFRKEATFVLSEPQFKIAPMVETNPNTNLYVDPPGHNVQYLSPF